MSITDFLLARIADDEAVARAASGAGATWSTMTEETGNGENIYFTVEVPGMKDSTIADMCSTAQLGRDQAEHIARHDPARILAECEAKRALVKLADDANCLDASVDSEFRVDIRDEVAEPYCGDSILYALAAVYSDHPDYRAEWKVGA